MDIEKGIGRVIQSTPSVKKGKKHILGIGINDYTHWSTLRNAINDLDDVISILVSRYDFDIKNVKTLKENEATRKNIVNTLHHYTNSSVLSEDDSLLIYFSGHGFLDENKDGHWVPVDSEKNDVASFIPNDTILSKIKNMKCRHVLLISDSCLSGSLLERNISTENLLADELEMKKSRWIITSGGRDETVSDGKGKNSPFAEAIISELKFNSKQQFIADVLALRIRSITRNNATQMPQAGKMFQAGDLGGCFVFYLKNYESEDWVNLDKTSISALETFCRKYPLSNFSVEAKNRIVSLKHDAAWNQAIKLHTETSYLSYLREYPNGQNTEKAKMAMRDISDDTRWQKVKRENSAIAFYEYIEDFPNGKYLGEAQAALEIFELEHKHQVEQEKLGGGIEKVVDEHSEWKKQFKVYLEKEQKKTNELQLEKQNLDTVSEPTIESNIETFEQWRMKNKLEEKYRVIDKPVFSKPVKLILLSTCTFLVLIILWNHLKNEKNLSPNIQNVALADYNDTLPSIITGSNRVLLPIDSAKKSKSKTPNSSRKASISDVKEVTTEEPQINRIDGIASSEKGKSDYRFDVGNDNGEYMVIGGSFASIDNANMLITKLKKIGFSKAEAVRFENSANLYVIAGRYEFIGGAEAAIRTLKANKVDSYFKKHSSDVYKVNVN
jgi:hypothetical protein